MCSNVKWRSSSQKSGKSWTGRNFTVTRREGRVLERIASRQECLDAVAGLTLALKRTFLLRAPLQALGNI